MMIYTGLRSTEFTNVTIENINLDEGYIIDGGKTKAGTNRIIPISNKIYDMILKRIDNRD